MSSCSIQNSASSARGFIHRVFIGMRDSWSTRLVSWKISTPTRWSGLIKRRVWDHEFPRLDGLLVTFGGFPQVGWKTSLVCQDAHLPNEHNLGLSLLHYPDIPFTFLLLEEGLLYQVHDTVLWTTLLSRWVWLWISTCSIDSITLITRTWHTRLILVSLCAPRLRSRTYRKLQWEDTSSALHERFVP